VPEAARPAPRFLRLWNIRFPVGAIASIAHRLSGVLLLLALPPLALALERSLHSRADYAALLAEWRSPWLAPLVFIAVWALAQHVLAGIRHLLMDIGIGWRLPRGRASAWVVLVGAPLLAAVVTLGWLA
jgi:succinate dehydrogenase / fumarate reductase, cytochrome b subunit